MLRVLFEVALALIVVLKEYRAAASPAPKKTKPISFNMKFIKEVCLYMDGGGCYTVHYDSRIPSCSTR
jgi:hypothetical protein